MPRPCHALTMPFFSRSRHSTAVERRPVGYLPAFGLFRLSRGVPRRLLSEAYQTSSQRPMPATVKSGSNTLQMVFRMCLSHVIYTVRPCLIHTCHAAPMPCSDHAILLKIKWERHILNTYRLGTARHGRGTAWARHAMCESAFTGLDRPCWFQEVETPRF
jgi:hypothetical protein